MDSNISELLPRQGSLSGWGLWDIVKLFDRTFLGLQQKF
jgi:hypothetical protein